MSASESLVSRLLEAIKETERDALAVHKEKRAWVASRTKLSGAAVMDDDGWPILNPIFPSIVEHVARHDPKSVLRRCAADREEVELHAIVWRDIGWLEWDEGEHAEMYEELPVCGLCVPKHSSFPTRADVPEGPCQTICLRARAYGISVEEETNSG